ncbi:MAG: YjjG family noncanonical pyrimidine nucleotidase [Cyclobacteriaceae bacterium]|nr:YjjG family noncanonical pyrimidine nucleotidase [Cyclobacteriaceae bacterium]MCH8515055.1 YjjG family noncanonical pyrimidine nucleotidase [Cyclobacteriaceae bacterium]
MSYYKHILFDLDHTLWDYEKNTTDILLQLYRRYHLDKLYRMDFHEMVAAFMQANSYLWAAYNQGKMNRQELRKARFPFIWNKIGLDVNDIPKGLSEDFFSECPKGTHLMPHSIEVLQYLRSKGYAIHILTNGFHDSQLLKLKSSGIDQFCDLMVCSDDCGFKKPDPNYFTYSLEKLGNVDKSECLMIGDSLENDVLGAKNVAIDQVFYNPNLKQHQESITYEIKCLNELRGIL